jgi:hypothetical protein
MRKVKCRTCQRVYTIGNDDIQRQVMGTARGITRIFFACPKCGDERTILYLTAETARMVARRTEIRNRISSGPHLQYRDLKDLLEEDNELKYASRRHRIS